MGLKTVIAAVLYIHSSPINGLLRLKPNMVNVPLISKPNIAMVVYVPNLNNNVNVPDSWIRLKPIIQTVHYILPVPII